MTESSRNSEGQTNGVSLQVLDHVSRLTPGSHAIFCYDDHKIAAQVFNSYLKGGFERREAVHIIAPNDETYGQLTALLDVDRRTLEETRQLNFVPLSDFVDNGQLSQAKAYEGRRKIVQTDRQLGFKATRILGLAEYYLDYASPSELLQFERASSSLPPLTSLCSYHGPRLMDRGLHELLIGLFEFHDEFIGKGLAWSRKSLE